MMEDLPPIQHTKTEGEAVEVWWYQEQGPQLVVWENPYAPPFRRWEVRLYPTGPAYWLKQDDWYHSAFPLQITATRSGRSQLEKAAQYYAKEHPDV